MALFRRVPLVRTTVGFHGGDRVSVEIAPGPGRWPEREGEDRLVVPLGIAALALARSDAAVMDSQQGRLRSAAEAMASGDPGGLDPTGWCAEVARLELVAAGEGGSSSVTAQLVRSPVGPVPTLGVAAPGALSVGVAATAALAVCSHAMGSAERLAAALSWEGVLGWYRHADPHLQPPQQAVAYALRHAAARLEESGRTPTPELAQAVKEHRRISPMAGGFGGSTAGGRRCSGRA